AGKCRGASSRNGKDPSTQRQPAVGRADRKRDRSGKAEATGVFRARRTLPERHRSGRGKTTGRSDGPDGLWQLMPRIATWGNLPAGVREHLIERMRDRAISIADLNQLRLWIEAQPEAPEGGWFKDFGSFKICGHGSLPK